MNIHAFEWDDDNETHVGHRVHPDDVDAILESSFLAVRNKAGSGTYKLIGRSRSGSLITVVVAPTHSARVWRPITAWPSDREERTHARKQGI